jgi:hypothetical protein
MAISTDEQTDKLPISKELDVADASIQSENFVCDAPVEIEIKPDHPMPGRSEEVPALLGVSKVIESRESDIIVTPISTENTPEENGEGAELENVVLVPDDQAESKAILTKMIESGSRPKELLDLKADIIVVQEGLRDSIAHCQYISTKVDAVSNDTENLLQQVKAISVNSELLTAELELISSGDSTKKTLSKSFLVISSTIVALLAISQVYIFISLVKVERIQLVTGSAVMRNISGLNKKMVVYDNNLTKALENQPKQEHTQPTSAVVEKAVSETHGIKEAAPVTSVYEKMNKLRNGLLEKKLIRKETGDWFVYNKKNDECISDIEVIEVLNQAYRKIGRSISSDVPMPSHNALCILKPDGKGGTEVVMTKTFVP